MEQDIDGYWKQGSNGVIFLMDKKFEIIDEVQN